eukprot:1394606-Amorphochlora_amoeboformis.AAC.1
MLIFLSSWYTGNQGETKATALLMEKKKLEDLIRDQVSGILMGAICITIKDLSTSNKLEIGPCVYERIFISFEKSDLIALLDTM